MQRMVLTVLDGDRITMGRYERDADDQAWNLKESRYLGQAVNGQCTAPVPVEWLPLTHGGAFGYVMQPTLPTTPAGQTTLVYASRHPNAGGATTP